MEKDKKKRPRGRPAGFKTPERIPDTPENIAQALFGGTAEEGGRLALSE